MQLRAQGLRHGLRMPVEIGPVRVLVGQVVILGVAARIAANPLTSICNPPTPLHFRPAGA